MCCVFLKVKFYKVYGCKILRCTLFNLVLYEYNVWYIVYIMWKKKQNCKTKPKTQKKDLYSKKKNVNAQHVPSQIL